MFMLQHVITKISFFYNNVDLTLKGEFGEVSPLHLFMPLLSSPAMSSHLQSQSWSSSC